MRILITGSTGMVGRNLIEHAGTTKFDLLTPSRKQLNLLDHDQVRSFIASERPEFIVHCAGVVGGIQANLREPVRYLVENFELGKNVVLAARENNVPRLLNLGSSCMYPRNAKIPLKEDSLLRGELEPTNQGYALAKISVDRLCEFVGREDPNLTYKTVIPPNLYGRWDDFSEEASHMLPAALRKVHHAKKSGAQKVHIWGSGEARREFMYAGDLADFLVFAIENFDRLPQRMNVGLGTDYTVNEYYQIVAKVVGYAGEFVHDLNRPVGMMQKLVDTSVMQRLGWAPSTALIDGIRHTYEFLVSQQVDS